MKLATNPLVSIITVCYNSENFIKDTIESVLNQTYNNIEYIIIDGKSTDNTFDIVKKYEPKFNGKMRWVSEKDDGIYDGMNKGIKIAKGEIIGIINSDDWYETYTVEQVVHTFRQTNADITYGDLRQIFQKLNKSSILIGNIFGDISLKNIASFSLNHPTIFVKKDVYDKYGSFNSKYIVTADLDLILKFLNYNLKFVKIPMVLANYRDGGYSSKNSIKFSITKSIEKYEVLFKNKIPVTDCAFIAGIQMCTSFGYYLMIKAVGENRYCESKKM